MKNLMILTICLFALTENVFSQLGQKEELILAYEPKSDSIYGVDNFCIYLYYHNSENFYLVYKGINYLQNFEYICRFGPDDNECFAFSSTSNAADVTKLIYWRTGTKDLFSCDIKSEFLMPVETSFDPKQLTVNCISIENDNCGALSQLPVKFEKKITEKDLIGNNLPHSLTIIRSWLF